MGILQHFRETLHHKRKSTRSTDPPSNAPHVSSPTVLPSFLPQTHSAQLPFQGWSPLHLSQPALSTLKNTSVSLFRASTQFFALDLASKAALQTCPGSEDGWSRIPGEKELLTIRTLERTPSELRAEAEALWAEAGKILKEVLGGVAETLGLEKEKLTRFVGPTGRQLGGEKGAAQLRLFRYEECDGDVAKIVSEPHSDLGLLTLVLGSTPGLEVWDRNTFRYLSLEQPTPPSVTLLVGRQLERLTNGRYRSGKHRVCAYPQTGTPSSQPSASEKSQPRYRYSVVFVLRAHWPEVIDTDELTTPATGDFVNPMRGITAKELFVDIEKRCFNVNTGLEERAEQKRGLNIVVHS